MASKVLKSFLIGIGYDTKALEAGDKKINASLQGIKSNTLGISAALVGAFGAGAGVIVSTANKIDRLAAAAQNMRTAFSAQYNFGNAVELMGGQAQEGYDFLKKAEDFQNNYKQNGQITSNDSLVTAGVDTASLARTAEHGDAMDFYRELQRQFQGLNEGQRAQVQSTLGFSDYVSRLLKEGNGDGRMAQAASYTGSIDQMTESARRFAESNAILSKKFEGLTNELTEKFLPSLIGASEWANKFLDEHRPTISKGIDVLAENPGATSGLLTGAVTAGVGATLAKWLPKTGGALKGAGQFGLVVSAADLMTPYVDPAFDKIFGVDRATPEVYSGKIERSQEDIGYLDQRERVPSESVPAYRDSQDIYGGRSAADSMLPESTSTREEDIRANAEALGGVLSRTPIKVQNQLGVTLQIDGQTLDNRIIQVNERQNYEAMGDFKPTTER